MLGLSIVKALFITYVFTILQTITRVCRRSDNYFVALFTNKRVVFFATWMGAGNIYFLRLDITE